MVAELLRSLDRVYFKITNTSKGEQKMKNYQTNSNRKVVFYGRVSTEHEAQTYALCNQMQWYKCQNELQDYLEKDEKWTILSIEKRREKIIGFAKKTWCDIGRFGIAKSKEAIEVIDSEED